MLPDMKECACADRVTYPTTGDGGLDRLPRARTLPPLIAPLARTAARPQTTTHESLTVINCVIG